MSQQDKFLMKNPQNDDMSIREVTLYYQKMDWGPYFIIQEMIKTDGLNFKNLPPEYTFIFDTMKQIYPDIKPVIEHFQASRQFKNKI